MKDIIPQAESSNTQKTLAEQRLDLQLKLQSNRRLLTDTFSGKYRNNYFPRSMVMRFLTQPTTLHVIKNIAYTTIGLKAVKSFQYGLSLWLLVRSSLQKQKQ